MGLSLQWEQEDIVPCPWSCAALFVRHSGSVRYCLTSFSSVIKCRFDCMLRLVRLAISGWMWLGICPSDYYAMIHFPE